MMIQAEKISLQINESVLLRTISFCLPAGSFTALVGASGSGKTVLARMLAGQIKPSEGVLNVAQGKTCAFVEQQDNFFAQTALQHTYYSQRYEHFEDSEVPVVAELMGIDVAQWHKNPFLKTIISTMNIEHLLNREILLLSNGERKRLQIAMAWMTNADFYIFDQAFVGLDISSKATLIELLQQFKNEGKTCLLLCDAKEIPPFADRVLELEKGQLQANASYEEFILTHKEKAIPRTFGAIPLPTIHEQNAFDEVVRMQNVNVKRGEKHILNNINWTVHSNERWLLSGHNGSGKSTLLSLITADNPQSYSNNIALFGQQRGSGESIWDIKKKIGFVSPELHLYFLRQTKLAAFKSSITHSIRCIDVLLSGFNDELGFSSSFNEYQRKQAQAWLAALNVEELANKQFAEVSLGKQRMLLLLRALIKNPPLLILDEPCQGVGQSQSEHFIEVLDFVCHSLNSTMIYVTHNSAEIPNCITRVLELEHGRMKVFRNLH